MRIELWEDLVCPWCGIADGRIAAALEQFEHRDEVEFVHKSFVTMPTLPEGRGILFDEQMGARTGMSPDQMSAAAAHIESVAAADGIESYHVRENPVGNTTLAHEFLAWAGDQGRSHDAWTLLLTRHFGERAALWTVDDLVAFADELGLDGAQARQALEAHTYRSRVKAENDEAVALGSTGVPFLVVDRKYGVSGAQSVETYVELLNKAYSEKVGR